MLNANIFPLCRFLGIKTLATITNTKYFLIPVILPRITKSRINLPHIPLQHNPPILLYHLLTIFVMIHPLLPVAVDDLLTEETDRLVGHLTFAGALFDGLEVFYWVFGAA